MLPTRAKTFSIIIAARNEEGLLGATLDAALEAAGYPDRRRPHLDTTDIELIVVDNRSTDATPAIARAYAERWGVRLLQNDGVRAPCARNHAVPHTTGQILVFVDADTCIPPETIERIRTHCIERRYQAGITGLASLEGGLRAWCWWAFWCQVRRLPLARAKAMPALMFCTRAVFDEFGPFDEHVAIGEEWPILAGLYRARPSALIYDRALVAFTSSRRMELQPFGYSRTLLRYLWAILHQSGRVAYSDRWRYSPHKTTRYPHHTRPTLCPDDDRSQLPGGGGS